MMGNIVYIGIDPGYREAGLGVINSSGEYIDSTRFKNWTPSDLIETLKLIQDEFTIAMVAVEEVHTFPGQGVVSSGHFMYATGIIIGIISALHIPFVRVQPKAWRSAFNIGGKKKDERKKAALNFIRDKFPDIDFNLEVYHNVAEALLIAEYIRLTNLKKSPV
jgi:Holliday junction resolvasome RuvABC endonuclease subunit